MDAPLQLAPVAGLSTSRWSVSRDTWEVLAHWLTWIAIGALGIYCDSDYLLNGWWMVVVAFWIDTRTLPPILATNDLLRPLALMLATIAAGVLIYITFTLIASDLSSWRPWGTERWQILLALPTQSFVASVVTALLLVPPLRHTFGGASVYLLFVGALGAGLTTFETNLISPERWHHHFTANCILWFETLILPLIVTAYAQRLDTTPWPRLRVPVVWLRLWRGEAPLGWVALVIYPLTLLSTYRLSTSPWSESSNVYAGWSLALLYAGLKIASVLLISVGSLITWRTIRRASERGIRSSRAGQVVVVLIATFFGLPFIISDGFDVGQVFNDSVKVMLGGAYKFELSDGGKELMLSGDVTYGFAHILGEQLKAHPGVRRIRLDSGGGFIGEATQAAELIAAHHFDTVVNRECSSACTLMFVAGAHRDLSKGGQLGFHDAHGTGPFDQTGNSWQFVYATYGIAPSFIARVQRVEPTGMWYPTTQELVAAGVLSKPNHTMPESLGSSTRSSLNKMSRTGLSPGT